MRPRRTLLDANVLLAGSLSVQGPSASLPPALPACTFVVPDANCAAIWTYDEDDFTTSPVPAWTPVEWLTHIDPQRYLLEPPQVGEIGTYLLATRTWGGDSGWIARQVFNVIEAPPLHERQRTATEE